MLRENHRLLSVIASAQMDGKEISKLLRDWEKDM